MVIIMSGIPHIYDSTHIFNIYEIDSDKYSDEINDMDYDELCEKIEEHLLEEKTLLERIRLMELI